MTTATPPATSLAGIPQSPMSSANLVEALEYLRANPARRDAVIRALVGSEPELQHNSTLNVREKLTGPFVDAMFTHGETVTKAIRGGLIYECGYTSKIIRDFVMAGDEPSHVYEPQNTRLMIELGRDARHVIIGGAFIGDHALPVAKAMRAGAMVHAFEVSPVNIGYLRKNAERNSIGNIIINEIALWSDDAARIGIRGEDSHASPFRLEFDDGTGVPATTIDRYVAANSIAAVDLILLDIEGGEIEALRGASSLLSQPSAKAPTVIFEVHRSYVDWSDGLKNATIVRHLSDHGYSVYALRDYNSNIDMADFPIELVDLTDIYLEGPPHGFNMVAIKNTDLIRQHGWQVRTGVSPKLLKHGDPAFHAPIKA